MIHIKILAAGAAVLLMVGLAAAVAVRWPDFVAGAIISVLVLCLVYTLGVVAIGGEE